MRRLLLVAFGAAVLSIAGAAQVFCADIVGVVANTQGLPVANVRILVKNMKTNAQSEAQSNTNGRYRVTGLAPGVYTYTLDPVGSGLRGGDAVSYLGSKGLTIDWHLSATNPAIALASDGTGTTLAGDPYGFTDLEYTGIVLGGSALIAGGVAGGLAASGEFSGSSSGSSSGQPASPSL
jgi:hypothetical protein